MNTGINFKIPTLQDYLDQGGDFTGRTKVIKKAITSEVYEKGSEEPMITIIEPAKMLYECEGCGCMCRPFELVDTSPLDEIPNDWMCGGCREKCCRDEFNSAKANLSKPHHQQYESKSEFEDADQLYYQQLHHTRAECSKAFKRALMLVHGAPVEVVETIGVIDKDASNRKTPPMAKAVNGLSAGEQSLGIEVIDAAGGIEVGKKVVIGGEVAMVSGIDSNQVSLSRENPSEHPAGAIAVFNIEEPTT